MVDMGAPEGDIDAYIAEEGTTVDAIRSFKASAAPAAAPKETGTAYTRFIESNPVTSSLVGLGGGLVKAGTGIIQAGAQALGADETAEAAGRVTQQANQNLDRLGTAGQIGGVVGEVAPYLALPASAATLGARIGLGAAGGAAQGALQAQETPDMAERGKDAAIGAALGAAIPAGAAGVGKLAKGGKAAVSATGKAASAIKAGTAARTGEALDAAVDGLKQQSNATYKAMRDAGAVLTPDAMQKVVGKVETAIRGAGKMNATIHGKTLSALSDLREAAQRGELSLEELDQFRQLFRGAASGFDDDARRAVIGIEAIDDAVRAVGKSDLAAGSTDAVSLLSTARKQWQQKAKAEAFSELIRKAEGDPQKLRTAAKNFLANRKKVRGWTNAEKAAMRDLANRGGVNGVLKLAGSFGFDMNNSLRNATSALIAGGSAVGGSPIGAGVVLVGTAAKQLENLLGRGQAEQVLRLIERGANVDDVARVVSTAQPARAAKAMELIGKSMPNQGVREQFANLGKETAEEAPKITRSAGQGTRLNARPEATVAGLALAGGLGTANFASSLATNTQYEAPPTRSEQQAYENAATMSPDSAEPLPDTTMTDAPAETQLAPANDNTPQSPISDALVDRIIGIESGGRSDAKNPLSSATGAGQFIASTWLGMVEKYRPELLVGRSKADVLKLRNDPYVSRYMVQKYAEDNANVLQAAGVPVSPTTVYLAHFLDGKVAAKLAKADPNTPAIKIVGANAVKANPSILRGKKAKDVLAWAQRKTGG